VISRPTTASTPQRAARSLWLLVGVAVLASGSVSTALTAHSGPFTGVRVAASGLVLVASVALAARVLLAIERARRRSAEDQATAHDPSAQ
jgi:hypothetical protein